MSDREKVYELMTNAIVNAVNESEEIYIGDDDDRFCELMDAMTDGMVNTAGHFLADRRKTTPKTGELESLIAFACAMLVAKAGSFTEQHAEHVAKEKTEEILSKLGR